MVEHDKVGKKAHIDMLLSLVRCVRQNGCLKPATIALRRLGV